MSDLGLIFVSALAVVTISVLFSHLLVARRAGWSSRSIALLSALPIPLLAILWAASVILSASMATRQQCGVDACAMAMLGALTLGGIAVGIYLLSAAIVYLIVKKHRA